jgi:hypothetical protein
MELRVLRASRSFAALHEFVIQGLIVSRGVVTMPTNGLDNSDRGEIVIYQASEGGPRLDVRLEKETIWLDAHQMAALFERDRTVIVRHIRNVYATGELAPEATCAKNAQVAADGKTYQVEHFNLDAIPVYPIVVNLINGRN